jgi:hypothetical protein
VELSECDSCDLLYCDNCASSTFPGFCRDCDEMSDTEDDDSEMRDAIEELLRLNQSDGEGGEEEEDGESDDDGEEDGESDDDGEEDDGK